MDRLQHYEQGQRARGDADIIALVQEYDARGQPIVIPALAIAGASLDIRSEEGDDLLAGLELLGVVTVAPLSGAEQAARLAHLVARTGLDPWDAHVAAIADVANCPILTLNAAKWEHASQRRASPQSSRDPRPGMSRRRIGLGASRNLTAT